MTVRTDDIETVHTDRLVLRPPRLSDAERLFALFNNWNVIRWLALPPWPYTRDDAESFLAAKTGPAADNGETILVIASDDLLIGGIGLRMRPASRVQRKAGLNLGFWLGEPYWGKGYMTEAAGALVRHVFATRDDDAIYSGAFVGNEASLRVQEKLGFVRDRETTMRSRPRGGEFPHVSTLLTRDAAHR